MEITTQLTAKQAEKLALIQAQTNKSPDQILDSALDYYYQQVVNAPDNHLDRFSQIGLIGCIEAEPNLAADSEAILLQELGGR
ncbi:hypothetical protein [[Phormidium] sp. ETS-05]|uniref:hypothetical protein n=1 Tax=[Phormidium] sp. ETS-05 TaxID=222819 RepID=UPI0018EF3492|nr:hypothetical protein [[Phormidium] sp. ETS-05]